MKRLATFLLLAGCLPKRITLDVPEWTVGPHQPADGPTVALAWPVDARPPSERTELGRYWTINLPLVTYGEANLSPGTLEALDRDLHAALPAMGIPVVPWDEADYRVRVFVLRHAGRRDVSDANWVSQATGPIAGTLAKFLTPQYSAVEGLLRVEVRRRDGTVAAVRDVSALHVESKALAITWQYWSLFLRSPTAELFDRSFAAVASDLSADVARVVDAARREEHVGTGIAPTATVYTTLDRTPWLSETAAIAGEKYGPAEFSVMSGHSVAPLVGRLGAPTSTLGYDFGLSDRTQLLVDLTVLGRVNSAGLGARVRWLDIGPWASAVELRGIADWLLFEPAPKGQWIGPWAPEFAGVNLVSSALVSRRIGRFTPYARLGPTVVVREAAFDSAFLPDLAEGRAIGLLGAPGLEVQLFPSVALAAELGVRRWWQGGTTHDELVPQVALGLR